MIEHTPTPYEQFGTIIGSPGHRVICRLLDGTSTDSPPLEIGSPNWEQLMVDAEFIIQACNAHDALLEACKELHLELEKAWGCGDLVHTPHDNPWMEWLAKWSDKLQRIINRATQ